MDEEILTYIIWIWFIGAVLMTQIVFLNVLIAIISDTFDRVWEQRLMQILNSQADILEDWLNIIPHDPMSHQNLYMYIVTPTHQQESDFWDGKI